jgi:hypothetical protein
MAAKFREVKASRNQVIDPVIIAPWKQPVQTVVKDKDEALQEANRHMDETVDIHADASRRNGKAGIGVFTSLLIVLDGPGSEAAAATCSKLTVALCVGAVEMGYIAFLDSDGHIPHHGGERPN